MKHLKFVPALVLLLMAAITTQASAQLFDMPVRLNLILEDDEADEGHVDASFGTGLNNASGKVNILAASYERSTSSLSFAIRGGYLLSGINDLTLGASVAAPLSKSDGTVISLQGGLGWFNFDAGITTVNSWSIPFGLGFQKSVDSGEADITLWGSPRIQWTLSSGGGTTNTSTNFGASGGVRFTLDSDLALHAEADYLNTGGGDPITFSVGAGYPLGSM